MRHSLVVFLLVGTLSVVVLSFAGNYYLSWQSLTAFGQQERARNREEGLAALERRTDQWHFRQVARARDIAALPVLIQGVMQPESGLRAMRRYLDHARWDGEVVQLDVLDFEGTPLYRRLPEPAIDLNLAVVSDLLNGERESFTRVSRVGDQAWIVIGVPVNRNKLAEGALVVSLELASLSAELTDRAVGGLEIRYEGRSLLAAGSASGGESIELDDSGLMIAFSPDLSSLEASVDSLFGRVAKLSLITTIAALVMLLLLMRRLLARPLREFVSTIEAIRPEAIPVSRVEPQSFSELNSLSTAFNSMLERLGESQRRLSLANAELEERVARRTEELQARNKDLEQFAYVASHDLQEPLRKISSFGEILRLEHADQLGEEGARLVGIMTSASSRMRALIQDLLEFSRIGAKDEQLRPVDLNRVAAAAREDLASALEEAKGVLRVDAGLPTVMGHAGDLTRLLVNLGSNAIKFAGDAAPEVHIGAEVVGDKCVLFVQDQGIGIEEKDFEKVFGMFDRLHSRSDYEGTGIGLAICRRIVEVIGGRIWLESRLGEGSRFMIALKLPK